MTHYPVSIKKMSKAWGHWGRKTACGLLFERSDKAITACERMITCRDCLNFLLGKHQRAMDILRYNLRDVSKKEEPETIHERN